MASAAKRALRENAIRLGPLEEGEGEGEPRPAGILDTFEQGFLLIDADLRVRLFNRAFVELLGYPPGTVRRGVTVRELVSAAAKLGHYPGLTVEEAYQRWLARFGERKPGRHMGRSADGRAFSVHRVPFGKGAWAITYEEATARIEAEKALAAQNERFDAALTNIPHGVCMFDEAKRLILCNDTYAALYSLPQEFATRGVTLQDILDYRASIGNAPADVTTYFDVADDAKWKGKASSRLIPLEDGRIVRITHNPIASGGYVAMHEDMTQATRAEERVRFLATHDVLTGLPNRRELNERAAAALARLGPNERLCVHYIDLYDFKFVNDAHGSEIGDLLLIEVGERLRSCLKPSDVLFRIGGDEFALLQGPEMEAMSFAAMASRLLHALDEPFQWAGGSFHLSASLGAAIAPADGAQVDLLLRSAETALYAAKAGGRNSVRFFEAQMDARLQVKRALEADLRRALANGEFELHYQPQVDAKTAALTGFEALIRWRHPVRGMVPPGEFIPAAEEIGLIAAIGGWVLRQACADAARWPERLTVAVNLSSHQFRGGDLNNVVLAALSGAGLEPSRLELEITESVLLSDCAETLDVLKAQKALGVRIALDDFGTGYSSLSYLRAFPVDKIKIDRSFIRDIGSKKDCQAIVRGLAALADALGMATTAEGVETADELQWVRQCGCSEVQGYYYGRPQPADRLFPAA